MKKKSLTLALLCLLNFQSFASTSSEQIYNALTVDEEEIQFGKRKKIGGLTCSQRERLRKQIPPSYKYICYLELELMDSAAIYHALVDVEESPLPAVHLVLKNQKSVGNLLCTKTDRVGGDITYQCELSELVDTKCVRYTQFCEAAHCTGGFELINSDESSISFKVSELLGSDDSSLQEEGFRLMFNTDYNSLFRFSHFFYENALNYCEAFRKTGLLFEVKYPF
ncbi:MAG: hypothetical protein OXB84_07630 [Halobacteriovoraceae bacterium]|nr:hypothetical protein [Halobacteriovoraceae bacterium]